MSNIEIIINENEIEEKIKYSRKRKCPIIIESENLKKSLELISKFEYILKDKINNNYSHKLCEYCKNYFPIIEGRNYNCKQCGEIFCIKHRELLNHHCSTLTPNYEKYLLAKSILKNKMKMIKNKAH